MRGIKSKFNKPKVARSNVSLLLDDDSRRLLVKLLEDGMDVQVEKVGFRQALTYLPLVDYVVGRCKNAPVHPRYKDTTNET